MIELKPVAEMFPAAPAPVADELEVIAPQEEAAKPVFRPLDELHREPPMYRWLWLGVATVFVALFAIMAFTFWAPAHGGVDQNGYLVGGRMFASSLTTKFVPKTPYEYVGNMWIMTDDGVYYPKYPLGLPILYAIPFWIGGHDFAAKWAFAVSPIGTIAAVAGMFFLGRAVAGSFAGLLGAILLGGSQIVLVLMNNPNSHAACMGFVVWGMYLLLRWWQTGSIWRGILAGFLLGYACLIRYTEGLLILPIVLAAACAVQWTNWRSYLRAAVPVLAWAAPVGYLLIFNRIAMGSWTGYDTTNESHGGAFTWAKFKETWEQVVRTFNDTGMFFTLPLGIAGIGLMFRHSWRFGLMLVLWLIPGTALYASYYWSPDRGVSYARFFVTAFPAVCLGFAVLARYALAGSDGNAWRRSITAPIVAGLLVAIASGVSVYRATWGLDDGRPVPNLSLGGLHRNQSSLAAAGGYVRGNVEPKSLIVVSDARWLDNMPNYLQFIGDYEVYASNAFSLVARRQKANRREPDADNPDPIQPARGDYIKRVDAGKDERTLRDEQQKLFRDRLASGQKIYVIGSPLMVAGYINDHLPTRTYGTKLLARWHDQVEPQQAAGVEAKPESPPQQRARWQNRGPGGPGGPGGRGGREPTPSAWQLIEVKLNDGPATRPAS